MGTCQPFGVTPGIDAATSSSSRKGEMPPGLVLPAAVLPVVVVPVAVLPSVVLSPCDR